VPDDGLQGTKHVAFIDHCIMFVVIVIHPF